MDTSYYLKRALQIAFLALAVFAMMGAGDQEARFQSVGHKLMCECGCGQVLLECNHVGCAYSDRMRKELASYLDRGDSDDLVLQAFVQKYGPTVLIAPTATGFNRVAWIAPYLALVLGLALVVVVVRTWRNRPVPALADGIAPVSGSELEILRKQAQKETEQ